MKDSILTKVLIELVNKKIKDEEYGVAIINLPSFDYYSLISEISGGKKHEVFFLGFSEHEASEIRNEMMALENATIAFSVEEAEKSRNTGATDVFRILIIKKAELEKLSSLRWFPEIDMEAVYVAACRLVKKELRGTNDVVTALISALGRKNIRNLLGFERVLDYLGCLISAKPEDLPSTISEQYYRLGLCMDERVSSGKHTTDSFIKLIKDNYSIVERIGNLEQSERQSVTNYYSNQESSKDVPRLILKYYEERDISILSKLYYSEVQACLQAAKRKPKDAPKTPPKAKVNRKPIAVATQLAFDNDEKHIHQLLDELDVKINNRSDVGKKKSIPVSVDGITLQINTNPITEAIAEDIVGESCDFGGVIYADVPSPADAIKDKAKYNFQPFKREEYLANVFEKLERVQMILSSDGTREAEKISNALKHYLNCRYAISKYSMRLQDAPMLQVLDERASFIKFLDAYEALLNSLNDNIARIQSISGPTAIDVLSAIVSLDNIFVIGDTAKHVIPTVLNPLYLWKYIKLADEIAASRGVSSTEKCYLSEKDKDFIIRKSEDIPDPLSVMPIPETLVSNSSPIFLPISGRVGLLPSYSTVKQVNQSESGIDALKNAIIRYLCLYPHAGMMLKITIIDPPSVSVIVNMLKMLNNDKDFNIEGIEVSIFRTSRVPSDWVEIEDKALNDGMLGTIKGKRSLKYRFKFYDKDSDYSTIISSLKHEQHIVTVFDPNDVVIQTDIASKNLHINPLCVPKEFGYDVINSKVEIKPTCKGDVFSVYTDIIERLNNHPSNNMQTSTYFNSPLNDSTYRQLLNKADWLIILDQSLRSWDISLQSGSEKIFYKENEYRSIGIYSKNCQKFILGYSSLIKHLGNLVPNSNGLSKVIDAVRDTNDDGLLSIVSHTSNRIFDANQGKGSLGTAIAAIKYKCSRPSSLLVGLDTQIAQEWLSNREDGKLPDLIGINLDDGSADIDIMEVKTYSNDPKAFVVASDDTISGHAVEQATILEDLLKEIFGSNEKLTTISRREILREQVYDCLYQADLAPEEKMNITASLNDLFAGKYKLNITKNIVFVDFEGSTSSSKEYKGKDDFAGNTYQLTTIGNNEIQSIITDTDFKPDNRPNTSTTAVDSASASLNEEPVDTSVVENEPMAITESSMSDVAGNTEDTETVAKDISIVSDKSNNEILRERCTRLTKAFRDYGINALPVKEDLAQEAARFTRFRVELKSGETVRSIEKYKADIARELEANGEILIDHIKGTRYISVDVPFDANVKPISLIENLSLLDNQKGALNIVAGQKPDGIIELLDIAKAPHMLVAGTTGSGKTIFLYSIIVSLLHQYSQDDIDFLIIDPKQTDFMFFDDLRCLYGGHVVTDAEEALDLISRINEVDKEERTALLKSCKSRDIESYNEKNLDSKMKRLVVIIDEYSDLIQASEMQGTRKDFEKGLVMLAQRVRNLGIHLIIATQRPSAQIVTGTLKANIPYRASFRLPSHTDSQTILDMSGAENLLGKGDMLLVTDNDTKRMQGLFISENELENFVNQL